MIRHVLTKTYARTLLIGAAVVFTPLASQAETEVQVFGGMVTHADSTITLRTSSIEDTRETSWRSRSFAPPIYWGVRGIHWLRFAPRFGLGLEFVHPKALAQIDFESDPVYDRLEFSHGNNFVMADLIIRSHSAMSPISTFLGVGLGAAVPHAEISLDAFPQDRTSEFQISGPSAQLFAGMRLLISNHFGLIAEAKETYMMHSIDVMKGTNEAGTLRTTLFSTHFILGVAVIF